jgi:hypothetical protein
MDMDMRFSVTTQPVKRKPGKKRIFSRFFLLWLGSYEFPLRLCVLALKKALTPWRNGAKVV